MSTSVVEDSFNLGFMRGLCENQELLKNSGVRRDQIKGFAHIAIQAIQLPCLSFSGFHRLPRPPSDGAFLTKLPVEILMMGLKAIAPQKRREDGDSVNVTWCGSPRRLSKGGQHVAKKP